MSICKSYRKSCPEFIVNDFVTKTIKTTSFRDGYATIRVTLKSEKITDKTLIYCQLTPLTVVCRKGCLVDIVDVLVKSSPKNQKLREVIPVKELFEREKFFYEEISNEVQQLGIAPNFIAADEEAIILQNTSGVKYEKWVGELRHEHATIILNEFAKFHGFAFIMSKDQTEKFEKLKKRLHGGFLSTFKNEYSVKIIRAILKNVLEIFQDVDTRTKLGKFDSEVETYLENILNDTSTGSVIIHGDPTSNFLFKYEKKEDGMHTPSRAKFTDWQLVKFGSPVLDLSLFFFTNCSSDDLNNNNITQFLTSYYTYLKNFIEDFGYNLDDFLSFKELEIQWQKYAKFGFAVAFLALKIMTMETSNRPNANDEYLTADQFVDGFVGPPNEEFKRRIKDLVNYGIENRLI